MDTFYATIAAVVMAVILIAVLELMNVNPPSRIQFDGKECYGWIVKTSKWYNVECNDGRLFKNVKEFDIIEK